MSLDIELTELMAAHKGPASLRPRCTRSGSSVAAIPVYQSTYTVNIIPAMFHIDPSFMDTM
jgi:hypothetical protein